MYPTLNAQKTDQFAKNLLKLERRRAKQVVRRIPALRSCAKKHVQVGNIVPGKVFAKMVILCLVFVQDNSIFCSFSVTCGTNSDCSTIPGRGACKQEKDGGKNCQEPSDSGCSCKDFEFCSSEDKCSIPGKILTLMILKTLKF